MRMILNPVNAAWGPDEDPKPGPLPAPPPNLPYKHMQQRMAQMESVAPFLGPGFQLLLERHGLSNPAAAYKAVSNAFSNQAAARGTNTRQLLMQLLAAKRSGGNPLRA